MKLLLTFIAGVAFAGALAYLSLKPAPPEIRAEIKVVPPPSPGENVIPKPVPAPPPPSPRPRRLFHPPEVNLAAQSSATIPPPPTVRPAEQRWPATMLASPPDLPPPPEPNRVTIAAGTILNVSLLEDLSSEKNMAGDLFSASLDQPLVIAEFIIAERGALVEGSVVEVQPSGKVKGSAVLTLQLARLDTTDGQTISIRTDTFTKTARKERGKDLAKVGVAASIGAAIGAIAGGGSGAAIGAAIGGGAGTGGVLLTKGDPAELPVETQIPFRLSAPVEITEQTR